ncbi:MAG: amidohydrolase, partial [Actinomycetota bacterium]|nr:amidohydrolase [Actinomycetota bacterium]
MGSTPTIFLARSFITMDDAIPRATAVAVQDGEIVAVGELDDVVATVGDDHEVDETFADNTVITGFIDQHLHPFLAASTLTTEIIA